MNSDFETNRAEYTIAGAAPDTGNLGVEALLTSAIAAIDHQVDDARLNVLDNGFGARSGQVDVGGRDRSVNLLGARHSKRLHRADTLSNIATLGALPFTRNHVVDAIRRSTAVLDISGGDSFSDIYGAGRFSQIVLHKILAIQHGCPLALMPQTIGPFESRVAKRVARAVLRRATVVVARDRWSHDQLRAILADDFDPERHRLGIDLAFALPTSASAFDADVDRWMASGRPVAGLNLSGLLYLDPDSAGRFGFADDYRSTVIDLVRALLAETDAQIVLVPHVVSPIGQPESDVAATLDVLEVLGGHDRLRMFPPPQSASEAKGMIARLDWFAGSRMHSTIAALSSGVPTASISYSDKAAGVFESAGMRAHVVDLRTDDRSAVVDGLLASFRRREDAQHELEQVVPSLRERAVRQVGEVLDTIGLPSSSQARL